MSRIDMSIAREKYPISTEMGLDEWVAFLATSDGYAAMGKMFYDIYNEVLSAEERRAGVKRQGRRPQRPVAPLSTVMAKVIPSQWSMEPLEKSLPELVSRTGMTAREFAAKVPMHESYVSKINRAGRIPPRQTLERIAEVGGVEPWYFLEWRAQFFADLVRETFLAAPNLGVGAVKAMRSHGRLQRPQAGE